MDFGDVKRYTSDETTVVYNYVKCWFHEIKVLRFTEKVCCVRPALNSTSSARRNSTHQFLFFFYIIILYLKTEIPHCRNTRRYIYACVMCTV